METVSPSPRIQPLELGLVFGAQSRFCLYKNISQAFKPQAMAARAYALEKLGIFWTGICE